MKLTRFYDDGVIKTAEFKNGKYYPLENTLEELMRGEEPQYAGKTLDDVKFANVTDAQKLLCIGLNYYSHAVETGGDVPKDPIYFSKFNDSLCPTGTPVELPPWQRCYDYEGELVIVIGKTCRHIEAENADDYIFGYTVGNDLSARDCQFLSNQWLAGKSMPNFAPTGPLIVTKDEFEPENSNAIITRVNGKIRQTGDTSDMIFSCRQLVANASKYFRLDAGDLIYTGTPAGVILGMKKGSRVWLKPGDTVEVEIENICTLVNKLV